VPIYNSFSTRPDPNKPGQFLRDPFPGSVIPASLLDPTMWKLAQQANAAPIVTGVPGNELFRHLTADQRSK
jgi:hypothetical protein